MSDQFRFASALSLALTLTFAVLAATGAKAQQQDLPAQVAAAQTKSAAPVVIDPASAAQPTDITVQPLHDAPVDPNADNLMPTTPAASLAELVDHVQMPETVSPDIECLAGAIYFEAKSESLAGQLAVGRVIVARTTSGRFPNSYCGVVKQPSQFSFVRGGVMPGIDHASRIWLQVVKIALIADRGVWKSPAEGALFFRAARVRPVAGKTRVARVDNQIFYR